MHNCRLLFVAGLDEGVNLSQEEKQELEGATVEDLLAARKRDSDSNARKHLWTGGYFSSHPERNGQLKLGQERI